MSSKPSNRMQRVSQSIREQMAVILQSEMKNPRLAMLNITDVRVTLDLRQAHVYFNRIGQDTLALVEQQNLQRELQTAAGFLRSALSKKLNIKFLPELHFHYDDQPEKGAKLRQLIESVVAEDQLKHNAALPGQAESSDSEGFDAEGFGVGP